MGPLYQIVKALLQIELLLLVEFQLSLQVGQAGGCLRQLYVFSLEKVLKVQNFVVQSLQICSHGWL